MRKLRFKVGDVVQIITGHYPDSGKQNDYPYHNGKIATIVKVCDVAADCFDYHVNFHGRKCVEAGYDDYEVRAVSMNGQLLFDWA